MEKKCPHGRSYEKNGIYWKCQDCLLDLTDEEVKKILVSKRQGFEIESDKD
mgnify:CR=1 FL=1